MKHQKDLKAIEQQLQYALNELQNEKPDIDLLHDWISDPLQRVKKLIIPDVVVSEAEVCHCSVDSCMHHKGGICFAVAWKCVDRQT